VGLSDDQEKRYARYTLLDRRLEDLYRSEPYVKVCLDRYMYGHISYEEAMILLVENLVVSRRGYIDEILKMKEQSINPAITIGK
jgi:hypothetical protein